MENEPIRLAIATAITLLLALPCAAQAVPDAVEEPATIQRASSFTLFFENDLFLGFDSDYTSGVGLSWGSGDASTYGPKHLVSRLANLLSFLPGVGDGRSTTLFAFTLGQEMYTPTDITSPVPPPDEQPYAGILFFDSAVYSHRVARMHEYTLRVGCVGPCSGAEQTQRLIHEWVGAPIPQGWAYQLDNEPLFNLGYQYHHRLVRRAEPRSWGWDASMQAGGALGNYYTGASLSLVARAGFDLPASFGSATLRTGGSSQFVGGAPEPDAGWRVVAYVGVNVYGVARFLPTDGNTFKESPSVERDPLIGMLSGGIVVGYRNIKLTWALNHLGGFKEVEDSRSNDFGTLTLTYFVQR